MKGLTAKEIIEAMKKRGTTRIPPDVIKDEKKWKKKYES